MITKSADPVAWGLLMYELEDASEHLASMLSSMESDPEFDEVNFRIELGHIYTHLNRAWHRRNRPQPIDEAQWIAGSQFPTDIF